MRCSGDLGYVGSEEEGEGEGYLMYVGREDRQVKRSGHRINLQWIEQVSVTKNFSPSVIIKHAL